RALGLLPIAGDVQVLAAITPATVVLGRQILLDLPHFPAAVGVEHVWRSEPPVEIDRATRVHREQFTPVIAIERDQVRDLLALRLGHFEPLPSLDLETDVTGRWKRDRLARFQDGSCAAHACSSLS